MQAALPEPALVREELQRLLESEVLRGQDSQRRLLEYLLEKSLEGVADQLKEYTVGLEAFHKPPAYDPRQEPSVRIQAGKLRQKLEAYYLTEGAADPVRIEFPKGGFKLTFHLVSPATPVPPGALHRWQLAAAVCGGLAVAFAAMSIWAIARMAAADSEARAARSVWTADLEQIWRPFLSERPVVLSIGTPLFVEFRDAGIFRAASINDWPAMQRSSVFEQMRQMFRDGTRPLHVYTGVGEAGGAFELARLLGTRRPDLVLTPSNVLSWEEIAKSNTVFLGPPKFAPQLRDIPVEQLLVVDSGADLIRNVRPQAGEPEVFPDQSGGTDTETHALISHLPGLHGRGDVFIFAANLTGATLGAVQYATQPAYAADLVRHLRLPNGELPRYYQILVTVQLRNVYPVQITYRLHRVLDGRKEKPAPTPTTASLP